MTDIFQKIFEKNSCGIETTCAEHKDMIWFDFFFMFGYPNAQVNKQQK